MRWSMASFFQSFQFRLLLYLLVVCLVPVLCAVFLVERDNASHADEASAQFAEQTHRMYAQLLENELENASAALERIGADYYVQQYISMPAGEETGKQAALNREINALLYKLAQDNSAFVQLCVEFQGKQNTLCTSSIDVVPADKTDKSGADRFRTVPIRYQGKTENALLYSTPLFNLKSDLIAGDIYAVISLSALLGPWNDAEAGQRIIVRDGNGIALYPATSADADEQSADNGRKWKSLSRKVQAKGIELSTVYGYAPFAAASPLGSIHGMTIVYITLLMALSLGTSVAFAKWTMKPLRNLQSLMKRAERGDLRAYWLGRSSFEMNELGESYNQMLNRLEELIKQVKHEESLKKEAEIEALQYQLNPHFLYNTLNTIKWVAKLHQTPQISEVVSALVRLLQASVGKKGDFITLQEEASLLRDYMDIQSFRYGDRVELAFEIEAAAFDCLVPRLILQPLVENAIIHGIEPAKRNGRIVIKAWLERDLLFCQVEDNGIGAVEAMPSKPPEALRERMSGIGLRHIREKIKLYYGPEYQLHINSKPGEGTIVRFFIPIHRNEV